MNRHGLIRCTTVPDAHLATVFAPAGNGTGGRAFRVPADPETKRDTRIGDAHFAEGRRGRDASVLEMIELSCDEAPRLAQLRRLARAATQYELIGCKSCAAQSDCRPPHGA